jgi:hypothetical protein
MYLHGSLNKHIQWLRHGSLSTHSKANKSLSALLEGHQRKAAFLVRNESLNVCEFLNGRMTTTLIQVLRFSFAVLLQKMDHEEQFSIEFFYFVKALRAFVRLDNQQKKGSKCSGKEREREREREKERRAFAWIRILLLSAGERISYETLERGGEKKTKDDSEMCSLEKI